MRFKECFALKKELDGALGFLPEAVCQLHSDQRKVRTSSAAPRRPASRLSDGWLSKKRRNNDLCGQLQKGGGLNSNFEVNLEKSLHLQSNARLAV